MRPLQGRAGRLRCVDATGIPGGATRPHPRPEPRSWAEAAFVPSRPLDGPAPAGAPVALAVQEITTLRASVLSRSAILGGDGTRRRSDGPPCLPAPMNSAEILLGPATTTPT